MNRSNLGHIFGAFVVAASLMLGLLAGTSSAMATPTSQIPASYVAGNALKPGVTSGESDSTQFGTSSACGWQSPIYRHCGRNQFILVRVDFSWSWDEEDIWVTKGETDLVWRFKRSIDFAWCVQNCG